jgi:hypothetical protein
VIAIQPLIILIENPVAAQTQGESGIAAESGLDKLVGLPGSRSGTGLPEPGLHLRAAGKFTSRLNEVRPLQCRRSAVQITLFCGHLRNGCTIMGTRHSQIHHLRDWWQTNAAVVQGRAWTGSRGGLESHVRKRLKEIFRGNRSWWKMALMMRLNSGSEPDRRSSARIPNQAEIAFRIAGKRQSVAVAKNLAGGGGRGPTIPRPRSLSGITPGPLALRAGRRMA